MESKYLSLIVAAGLSLTGCGVKIPEPGKEIKIPGNEREGQTNYAPIIEMIKSPKESYTAGEQLELEFRVLDDSGGTLFGLVDFDCPPAHSSSIITSNEELKIYDLTIGEKENPCVVGEDGRYSVGIVVSDWDSRAINGAKETSTTFYFRVEGLKPWK